MYVYYKFCTSPIDHGLIRDTDFEMSYIEGSWATGSGFYLQPRDLGSKNFTSKCHS